MLAAVWADRQRRLPVRELGRFQKIGEPGFDLQMQGVFFCHCVCHLMRSFARPSRRAVYLWERSSAYKFYDLVKNINRTYNVFRGEEETNDYKFEVYDIEEAIEKFRYLCMPENESHSNEDKCWFYLILFYLNKCGFIIKEFPRLIDHPPEEPYDFVNKEIRKKLISEGKDDNGTVRYRDRRFLVSNMTFHQRAAQIELNEAVERKFEEISNRGASFQTMSMDEKLAEIANLIENLLKKNGKFWFWIMHLYALTI